MSVCLIVTSPNNLKGAGVSIPLAAEEVYKRYWLPGAQEIGAYWLPLFQTGVSVKGEQFEEISAELVSFRGWLQLQPFNENLRRGITSRIDLLLEGLNRLYAETNGNIEVFIG